MRLNLRVALWLLIALVAVGGLWSTAQPDATKSGSSIGKRVTLVIDFGAASGIQTRVQELDDVSQDATGWSLFETAGVSAEGTSDFPTGFVCRLEGWPTRADQDCADTPKYSEGHWAYYVTSSEIGPGWLLSGRGAATQVPECGGFEGWTWVEAGEECLP
jgi:hypothetical protein